MQRKRISLNPRRTRGEATRERLLDAAEHVFASEGLGASLRTIMTAAAVNVASIHYYFGTKEHLLDEVVKRRALIINQARLDQLGAVGSGPLDPSRILEALMRPALTLSLEGPPAWSDYFRILGRLETSAGDVYGAIMATYYNKVHVAFLDALAKALPHLEQSDLIWRYYSVVSVMSHAATTLDPVRKLSKGKIKPGSADEAMRRLMPGLTALLTAPATKD